MNDWIAVHVVDFFNRINLLYGTISDFCTEQTCPTIYDYLWCDGLTYKKPTALPAPKYITLLMEWVESQINDENIFPVKVGVPFPKNYMPEAHVNTCYKHYYYFVNEYNLVDKKELEPL
ncbi:hypothetical protein KUTeg_022808, partial [Tegillarca granosa]